MDVPGNEPDDRPDAIDGDRPAPAPEPVSAPGAGADLERVAGDLADIERALDRLSDGSYWSDEVTGEPIPDAVLAEDPTARRVAYVRASQPATDETGAAAGRFDAGTPPTGS
jgi:hypothetical protein